MPKTKSFQKYIETRFSKQELAEIKAEVKREVLLLRSIQKKKKLTSLEVDTRSLFNRDEANERR